MTAFLRYQSHDSLAVQIILGFGDWFGLSSFMSLSMSLTIQHWKQPSNENTHNYYHLSRLIKFLLANGRCIANDETDASCGSNFGDNSYTDKISRHFRVANDAIQYEFVNHTFVLYYNHNDHIWMIFLLGKHNGSDGFVPNDPWIVWNILDKLWISRMAVWWTHLKNKKKKK